MQNTETAFKLARQKLTREWAWMVVLAVGLCVFGTIGIQQAFGGGWGLMYGLVAGVLLGYQLFHLLRNLASNFHPSTPEILFPDLGLANWITLTRAFLLALLAGFIFLPAPVGWLAWTPGILYLLAALLDFVDGSVARLTRRSTRLGEILDMHWDGFGVLVAGLLLVHYAQVPFWYLLVGLARYLYVFGIWLRRRRGLPVYDLPPNVFRRALAGTQMGFIGVVLLPIFSPPATEVAAAIFALPLLVGFVRDWFFVCGVLDPAIIGKGRLSGLLSRWGPLFLRGFLAVLVTLVLVTQVFPVMPAFVMIIVGVLLVSALVVGAAGRLSALVLLLLSAFALQITPLDWRYWAVMLLSAGVMTFGTGRFSLWKPEEWLIYHRIGDPSGSH